MKNVEIKTEVNLLCPKGFYCRRGERGCIRIGEDHKVPYCEVFRWALKKDSKGNIIKCEQCLLAEREARIKE